MNIETESASIENNWALKIGTWLPVFAFAIPFLITGPQLLTGTIVNTLLYIASAKQLNRKSLYFIALLPSLGAVSNGLLFAKFTPFLLFFIPSIWLGNMILILYFAKLKNTMIFPFNVIFSSILKTAVLFLTALIFNGIHLVPTIFLTSMGIFQLITATIGGFLAFSLFKIAKYKI